MKGKGKNIYVWMSPHEIRYIYKAISPGKENIQKLYLCLRLYKKVNFYYMIVRKYLLGSIELKLYNNTERSVMQGPWPLRKKDKKQI